MKYVNKRTFFSVIKAEKREQIRVDKLKNSATSMQKSSIDVAREQSMREMYQDMIDKLAEMVSYEFLKF